MDDALLDIVLERLDESGPSVAAADLIVAACESSECLETALGETSSRAVPRPSRSPAEVEPAGAYLRSIRVQGFRGIGPESTLPLTPGPGLTVVAGRNGSGKSSFAEGLELLLTGNVQRWRDLTAVWKEGWRNMHVDPPTEVVAELYMEEDGHATARRIWESDAKLDAAPGTFQVTGQQRRGIETLGWDAGLATFRPFLAHSELDAFVGRPSDLYDMLASVLGLDDLTETINRLAKARKPREAATRTVRESLAPMLEELAAVDDPRAATCLGALSGHTWDLDAAEAEATGTPARQGSPTTLDQLRGLAQLTVPSSADAEATAARLEAAADRLEAVADTDAARAASLAQLLRAARRHHDEHGDGPCPVCRREGALDAAWHADVTAELTRLDHEAKSATAANQEARATCEALASLAQPLPVVLAGENPVAGVDIVAAREAWLSWAAAPPDSAPDSLRHAARTLREAHNHLATAIDLVSRSASAELTARDDRWAPLATRVAGWCATARDSRPRSAKIADLKKAEKWLKDALDDIRNLRLRPLADEARTIWSALRQESSVELDALRLVGGNTRRQLSIDVTVDGSPSPALGVMSQGEINALALSIFIPRATLPASPFRFLMLDDPVQAMDPAKVDGLARVLDNVAKNRQVIVFTHDDRLPEALRRLEIKATLLEVSRRPRSKVEIKQVDDPVQRALKDAWAVSKERSLDEGIKARLVGGFCRVAVEMTFMDATRRRLLKAGRRHADVEELICDAGSFTRKAALALFDDPRKTGEVHRRLESMSKRHVNVYRDLCGAGHKPSQRNIDDLISDTRWLTRELARRLG